MYISEHLKWRILVARTLKSFYYERENADRNRKRVFELYGKYLLGTTYDTFLNYLKKGKYIITDRKLPSSIVVSLGLLDAVRITCEHLHARKPNASWSLVEIVEELLEVVRRKAGDKPGAKLRID